MTASAASAAWTVLVSDGTPSEFYGAIRENWSKHPADQSRLEAIRDAIISSFVGDSDENGGGYTSFRVETVAELTAVLWGFHGKFTTTLYGAVETANGAASVSLSFDEAYGEIRVNRSAIDSRLAAAADEAKKVLANALVMIERGKA